MKAGIFDWILSNEAGVSVLIRGNDWILCNEDSPDQAVDVTAACIQ